MKRCFSCMQLKESSPHCEHCGFDERNNNNSHQLPVGTVVGGQYILGRVLGQGGFGITYIAWDQIMQQTVAVKEYFPSGFAGRDSHSLTVTGYDTNDHHAFESNKKRFLREAESLAKLWSIPQIVKVLRCFEENGTVYIAMEYVEGMDLRKYMKRLGRPLSVDETLTFLGPIVEALSHVHKAGLVHRDISPDNIMVLPDRSTKLLDFGAARYVENADAEKDRNTSTQAILKHGFAPPEQYSSHGALGPWTDVYAICGTFYYCLTGNVPPEAMHRSMGDEKLNWQSIPGLTTRQRKALEKGMALPPRDRFASAQELWEKLQLQKHKNELNQQPELSKKTKNRKLKKAEKEDLKKGRTKKSPILIGVAAVIIIIALVSFILPYLGNSKSDSPVIIEQFPVVATTKAALETYHFTYIEDSEGLAITGYSGNIPDTLIIPDSIDGKPVHSIGTYAFRDCSNLTNVTISNSIHTIEIGCFQNCVNLTNISIPSSLANIGADAFTGTPWLSSQTQEFVIYGNGILLKYNGAASKVTVPDSVTVICEAFENCATLTHVTIPDSVVSINDRAFYGCSKLISVDLPNSIKSIGKSAFAYCTSLSKITTPESVRYIDYRAFYYCKNLRTVKIHTSCVVHNNAFPSYCKPRYYS